MSRLLLFQDQVLRRPWHEQLRHDQRSLARLSVRNLKKHSAKSLHAIWSDFISFSASYSGLIHASLRENAAHCLLHPAAASGKPVSIDGLRALLASPSLQLWLPTAEIGQPSRKSLPQQGVCSTLVLLWCASWL